MPKSKTRKKKKQGNRPAPEPKRAPKASPSWYPVFMLGLIGFGVLIIVLNYMQVIPGYSGETVGWLLWVGLGFIAAGFLAATKYR